jgi:hypothetical protein
MAKKPPARKGVKHAPRFHLPDPAQAIRSLVEAVADDDKLIVGIDPGQTGAIAFMPVSRRLTPVIVDMPTTAITRGDRKRTRHDYQALCRYLDPLVDHLPRIDLVICLERGQPRPRDRGVTGFAIGVGYGLWHMHFAAFALPYEEAMPAVWKGHMGLTIKGGGDTEASKVLARNKATELFPRVAHYFTGKTDHNRAEALLLAEWLRRRHNGK